MEYKLVIGTKDGKCHQVELKGEQAEVLHDKIIGEIVNGDVLGFVGYEFLITGGSDKCGFPMRKGIESRGMVKIYAQGGVGIRKGKKGMISRKSVAGAVADAKTTQLNLKVLTYGKKSVTECFGIEEKREVKEENVLQKTEN